MGEWIALRTIFKEEMAGSLKSSFFQLETVLSKLIQWRNLILEHVPSVQYPAYLWSVYHVPSVMAGARRKGEQDTVPALMGLTASGEVQDIVTRALRRGPKLGWRTQRLHRGGLIKTVIRGARRLSQTVRGGPEVT